MPAASTYLRVERPGQEPSFTTWMDFPGRQGWTVEFRNEVASALQSEGRYVGPEFSLTVAMSPVWVERLTSEQVALYRASPAIREAFEAAILARLAGQQPTGVCIAGLAPSPISINPNAVFDAIAQGVVGEAAEFAKAA